MTSVLELNNLEKSFGKVHAVRGVSFEVSKGECFGLLGPNGAGKSTILEMIEQITKPSSGEIKYFGKKAGKSMLDELGVQFQSTALLPSLTVEEAINTFSGFYTNARSTEELIELCDLSEFKDRRHEKLSGGQRQRLLLAIALANRPKLLLLDEPTTGLDPQARRNLWETITEIKKEGTTIILTTHYMDEAEMLCDRLVIVDHGKILAEGEPSRLIREHLPEVVVELKKPEASEAREALKDFGGVSYTENRVCVSTKNLDVLMKKITGGSYDLSELNVRQPNLEDFFISLTGKTLRD